mmetsp:Transcript_38697/g.90511  ORF Transcript_38697/g.90511 Transcript_38697/m.90511 type:complete len:198 (-) Transcript_38697:3687-4280(-)
MPELKVLATSVLDLRIDVGEDDLDLDRHWRRLFALDSRRRQVVRVVEVELLDWRELRYAIWPQYQIKRFADRALANVVRADDQGVPVEVQLGALDAPKVRDLQPYDLHSCSSPLASPVIAVAPSLWSSLHRWRPDTLIPVHPSGRQRNTPIFTAYQGRAALPHDLKVGACMACPHRRAPTHPDTRMRRRIRGSSAQQ